MPIVGGLDIHRKQITFDVQTGQVWWGQIAPADRGHLAGGRAERFAGRGDVEFAVEGCTGGGRWPRNSPGPGCGASGRSGRHGRVAGAQAAPEDRPDRPRSGTDLGRISPQDRVPERSAGGGVTCGFVSL